jgi:hypothetical protein
MVVPTGLHNTFCLPMTVPGVHVLIRNLALSNNEEG